MWLEEVEEGRTLSFKFDGHHWVAVLGPDVLLKLLLGSFQLPASLLLQKLMGMFKEIPNEVTVALSFSFFFCLRERALLCASGPAFVSPHTTAPLGLLSPPLMLSSTSCGAGADFAPEH